MKTITNVSFFFFLMVAFGSSFAQNVTVLPDGRFGIRNNSPLEQFQIGDRWTFHNGGTKFIGYNVHWDGSADKRIISGPASQMRFEGNQIRFLVAATGSSGSNFNPSNGLTLSSNGNLTAEGRIYAQSFITMSDERLKSDINNIDNALLKVTTLKGVSFKYKDSGVANYGFIAQDVEKIIPEIVTESKEMKALDYNALIPFLVEAIKEQQLEIETLKKEINSLKN